MKLTHRAFVLCAVATLVTAAAAAAWQPGRDRQTPPGDPAGTAARDVAPMELTLAAYRLEGTVVLVAKGKNRSGGFETRLERTSAPGQPPEFALRNTPPGPGLMAAQAITPFDATGYFAAADQQLNKVAVKIAGRAEQVEVKAIKEIEQAEGGERGRSREGAPPAGAPAGH